MITTLDLKAIKRLAEQNRAGAVVKRPKGYNQYHGQEVGTATSSDEYRNTFARYLRSIAK